MVTISPLRENFINMYNRRNKVNALLKRLNTKGIGVFNKINKSPLALTLIVAIIGCLLAVVVHYGFSRPKASFVDDLKELLICNSDKIGGITCTKTKISVNPPAMSPNALICEAETNNNITCSMVDIFALSKGSLVTLRSNGVDFTQTEQSNQSTISNKTTLIDIGSIWILCFSLIATCSTYTILTRMQHVKESILEDQLVDHEKTIATDQQNLNYILKYISETSGIMLWFLSSSEQIELFGNWPEVSNEKVNLDYHFDGIENGDDLKASLSLALTGQSVWTNTYYKEIDDEKILFLATATPIYTTNQQFLGLIGVRTNVSDALAQKLIVLKKRRNNTYETKFINQALKESVELIGNIKHFITKDTIKSNDVVDRVNDNTIEKTTNSSFNEISEIINNLVDLLTINDEYKTFNMSYGKVDDNINRIINKIQPLANDKNQSILLTGKCLYPVQFSTLHLEKIIEQLLLNAIKSGSSDSEIIVDIDQGNARCVIMITNKNIEIHDNAIGSRSGIALALALSQSMGSILTIKRLKFPRKCIVASLMIPMAAPLVRRT